MTDSIAILVADDEKAIREGCRRLLSAKGYRVVTAENGKQALDLLSQDPTDILLLDLKMPVMGGEEVLEVVRKDHPDIPVIIITGHGTVDIAVECMKKGAYDFITKPFQVDQFLITINRAADKKRLEQKARQFQEENIRNLYDLSLEKSRLKTIVNCMANGVMVTNRNMEIVLHNPAFARLLEISGDIPSPVSITEVIRDEALVKTLEKILRAGISESESEFISQEIHVGRNVLRAISAPALGIDRNVFLCVVGTVTVLEDITAFKHLDQMKSDFVNMVAHELRSPLVAIRQLNSVLVEGLAGPLQEKQKDFVSRGVRKIDALLDLINDLLNVARLEEGRFQQRQVPTDIHRIIEEVCALMAPRAGEQGIRLSVHCEKLRPVFADPKSIEEIFNNLISNAI
ncbi:MAG: response regulator, partial [Deltaproteobacteria bacterium]|nr:response regulator [Deltaproteobacteria bacterium]